MELKNDVTGSVDFIPIHYSNISLSLERNRKKPLDLFQLGPGRGGLSGSFLIKVYIKGMLEVNFPEQTKGPKRFHNFTKMYRNKFSSFNLDNSLKSLEKLQVNW